MDIQAKDINDQDYYKYVKKKSAIAAFSVSFVLALACFILAVIASKTDLFINSDRFVRYVDISDKSSYVYRVYHGNLFDLSVDSFSLDNNDIIADVSLTNNSSDTIKLNKNDFVLIGYSRIGTSLQMRYYPDELSEYISLPPGEKCSFKLIYNISFHEDNDPPMIYSISMQHFYQQEIANIIFFSDTK